MPQPRTAVLRPSVVRSIVAARFVIGIPAVRSHAPALAAAIGCVVGPLSLPVRMSCSAPTVDRPSGFVSATMLFAAAWTCCDGALRPARRLA